LRVEHQNGAEIMRSRRSVEQDLLAQLRFLGADLGALPPVDDFLQRQVESSTLRAKSCRSAALRLPAWRSVCAHTS